MPLSLEEGGTVQGSESGRASRRPQPLTWFLKEGLQFTGRTTKKRVMLGGRGQFEERRSCSLFAESINASSLLPSFQTSTKVSVIQLKFLGCCNSGLIQQLMVLVQNTGGGKKPIQ